MCFSNAVALCPKPGKATLDADAPSIPSHSPFACTPRPAAQTPMPPMQGARARRPTWGFAHLNPSLPHLELHLCAWCRRSPGFRRAAASRHGPLQGGLHRPVVSTVASCTHHTTPAAPGNTASIAMGHAVGPAAAGPAAVPSNSTMGRRQARHTEGCREQWSHAPFQVQEPARHELAHGLPQICWPPTSGRRRAQQGQGQGAGATWALPLLAIASHGGQLGSLAMVASRTSTA